MLHFDRKLQQVALKSNTYPQRLYVLQESATVKIDRKLTAVHFITSIRARPNPIASKGGGYTLATETSKMSGTTLTCTIVIILESTEYFDKDMRIIVMKS